MEESENVSANGRDRLVLSNGTSYITFTGAREFGGDPQACVDDFVTQLTADPNVSNLRLATDEQGNPLQGGTAATGAYAVYNHDYTFPDRVEPYTLFVGCVPLIPNEAVLAIVQNVPTADYDDQVHVAGSIVARIDPGPVDKASSRGSEGSRRGAAITRVPRHRSVCRDDMMK